VGPYTEQVTTTPFVVTCFFLFGATAIVLASLTEPPALRGLQEIYRLPRSQFEKEEFSGRP
jgi:hypothetical protein